MVPIQVASRPVLPIIYTYLIFFSEHNNVTDHHVLIIVVTATRAVTSHIVSSVFYRSGRREEKLYQLHKRYIYANLLLSSNFIKTSPKD